MNQRLYLQGLWNESLWQMSRDSDAVVGFRILRDSDKEKIDLEK